MPKLTIEANTLHEMLDTVKGAIPSGVQSSELEGQTPGIRITVEGEGKTAFAQAHSANMSIKSDSFPIISGEDGSLDIPASWILKAQTKLPNNNVSLETKGESDIVLKSGRFRTVSEQTQVAIYEETKEKDSAVFTVDIKEFCDTMSIAMKSMGKNDYRYIFNGVHLEHNQGMLSCTSTNGHNASRCRVAIEGDVKDGWSTIVPSTSLGHLLGLLRKHASKSLEIMGNENAIVFTITDGPTIISPVILGKYPSMAKVFGNHPIEPRRVIFTTNRASLIAAVERVSALSKEGGNPVVSIKADEGKNKLIVSLPEDAHNGRRKARDEVEITREDGYDEAITSTFNGNYLSSLLKSSRQETVKMAVANQGTRKQTVIDLDSEEPIDVIIMPINL